MKKILTVAAIAFAVSSLFVACSKNEKADSTGTDYQPLFEAVESDAAAAAGSVEELSAVVDAAASAYEAAKN